MTNETLTRKRLKTPNAAAVAGLLFSLLLMATFALLRISVPADPQKLGSWLRTDSRTVALATNLVPLLELHFCGLSACCVTGSVSWKIDFLQPCFSEAVFSS